MAAIRASCHRRASMFACSFPRLLLEGDRIMRKVLTLVAVGVLFSGLGLLRADDKGSQDHHQG